MNDELTSEKFYQLIYAHLPSRVLEQVLAHDRARLKRLDQMTSEYEKLRESWMLRGGVIAAVMRTNGKKTLRLPEQAVRDGTWLTNITITRDADAVNVEVG